MASLRLQKVTLPSYPQQIIDLEVADRETVVIAGPPDAGGSELVRGLAGLEPVGGNFLVGDQQVETLPPHERGVALVQDRPALFPHLTVRENLALPLKLRRHPAAEIRSRTEEAARLAGVTPLLDEKPAVLSREAAVRVALGRAIAQQARAILLDHPFRTVRSEEAARLRADLLRIQHQIRATMLFASDDPDDAFLLAQRVAILRDGDLLQLGTPDAVYRNPVNRSVARFFGDPPMNLVEGELRTRKGTLRFEEIEDGAVVLHLDATPGTEAYIGKPVVLGFHPESGHLLDAEDHATPNAFQALVDLAEPWHGQTRFLLQTGSHELQVIHAGRISAEQTGRRMRFAVAPDRLLLFDPKTGERIGG